jgi:hypothetical protein
MMLLSLEHYSKMPTLGGSKDGLYSFEQYIRFYSIAS